MQHFFRFFLLLLVVICSHAEESPLKAQIAEYLQSQISTAGDAKLTVTVGYIDPRLNLSHCEKNQLVMSIPYGKEAADTSTVKVACQNSKPWSIYVPVTIAQVLPVVVSAHALQRGTVITEQDIQVKSVALNALKQGYFQKMDGIVGNSVKQNVRAGEVISPTQLQRPSVVHKGQGVEIVAKINNIVVNQTGIAMADGAEGDLVSVQNQSSGTLVQGKVMANAQVLVTI